MRSPGMARQAAVTGIITMPVPPMVAALHIIMIIILLFMEPEALHEAVCLRSEIAGQALPVPAL